MEIDGLEEYLKSLEKAVKKYDKEKTRTIQKIGMDLIIKTKSKTRVDTGQLRRSWQIKDEGEDVLVYNNTEYALHIEYGHRTRNGGFVDGTYMLTKSVDEIQKKLDKDLEIMVDNLFK